MQECWSGGPRPLPGGRPDPGAASMSLTPPALAGGLFTTSATWEAPMQYYSATKKNEIMPLAAAWMGL